MAETRSPGRPRPGGRAQLAKSSILCPRFGHTNVLVGRAIIEKIAAALAHHAFDKNYVGYLPDLLPFFLRSKDRLVAAGEKLARIITIKNRNRRPIDEFVIGSVIDENDAIFRDNRRRSRLDHPRIELARPPWQNRRLRRLGPMNEICRVR